MKSYKLFQICYTVNFIICLIVIGFIGYTTIIKFSYATVINMEINSAIGFLIVISLVVALFAIFDAFCHHLVRSIKTDTPLSESSINRGENFKNICLVISVLLALGITSEIMSSVFEVHSKYFNFRKYFLGYCCIVLIVTSLYLGFTYPSIVKQGKGGITDTIDKIGTEDQL